MAWKTFPVTLTASTRITRSVLHLAFEYGAETPFEFTAGQFINIHFESDGKQIHRSYSLANPPAGLNTELALAMAPVEEGRATKLLSELSLGDQIDVSGPYGRFVLRDEQPERLILVATGTGVTPYRSMLPTLAERLANESLQIELFLGVRSREDALYADEFSAFSNAHENFRFHACYSRGMPEDPAPHEHAGYVQEHFMRLEPDGEKDVVYLCGNPDMIDAGFALLREREFPTKQVRREKYLPARN